MGRKRRNEMIVGIVTVLSAGAVSVPAWAAGECSLRACVATGVLAAMAALKAWLSQDPRQRGNEAPKL